MPDTPDLDRSARDLSETLFSAYAQQATGSIHPQHEQVLLARLAEAIRPVIETGRSDAVAAAVNAALDQWEVAEPGVRGPRVKTVDVAKSSVVLSPAD